MLIEFQWFFFFFFVHGRNVELHLQNDPKFIMSGLSMTKIGAIAIYTTLYALAAGTVSAFINKAMPDLYADAAGRISQKTKKSDIVVVLEAILALVAVSVSYYIIRWGLDKLPNIVKSITSRDFDLTSLDERYGGLGVALIYFTFQTKLGDRLTYLSNRVNNMKV